MRRAMLLLLFLALPLQYAWAAVGGYCQHEEDAGQWHFAHHVHEHLEDEDGAGSEAPEFHPDAHHAIAGMPESDFLPQWRTQAAMLVVFEPHLSLGEISSEPERPKWAAAG